MGRWTDETFRLIPQAKRPVAESKDSAAGFFLPMEIIMKEIAVKSEGVLPKRAQQIRPKRFTCVYVDNDSVF